MSILGHAEVPVALDLSGQVAQVLTDLLHDTGSALWLPGKLRQLWLRAQESGQGGGGKSFHPRIQVDPGILRWSSLLPKCTGAGLHSGGAQR